VQPNDQQQYPVQPPDGYVPAAQNTPPQPQAYPYPDPYTAQPPAYSQPPQAQAYPSTNQPATAYPDQTQQQAPAAYAPATQYGRPSGPNPAIPPAMPPQATPAPKPTPRPKNTTQNSLLFSEIRDNMMIMSDGSFRAVIACKSINFDLMSSREREGVEFSYQNFINSLTHPVQILIRSQKVDIGPYLERLVSIRKNQDNMLLGVLMDDYIEFIEILSEEANIMDKSFYVVVPYSSVGDLSNIKDAGKGFFSKLLGGGASTVTRIDKIAYEKAKDEIKNRVDSVTSGLYQMGVHCVQLNSKELGELYYNYYNPDTAVREPLGNFEQNTFTYVKKGEGEASRPNLSGGGM
jgi:hypothetical protein